VIMVARIANFVVEQGATFAKSFTWKEGGVAKNLTGYTARMKARPSITSDTVIIDASTANGKITIDPLLGVIELTISATETAAMTFTTAVYDLELVSGAVVTRLVQGTLTLSREVTR